MGLSLAKLPTNGTVLRTRYPKVCVRRQYAAGNQRAFLTHSCRTLTESRHFIQFIHEAYQAESHMDMARVVQAGRTHSFSTRNFEIYAGRSSCWAWQKAAPSKSRRYCLAELCDCGIADGLPHTAFSPFDIMTFAMPRLL